jgi:hypothetical protein
VKLSKITQSLSNFSFIYKFKMHITNANQFEKSSPANSLLPSEAPLGSLASGIVLLLDPVFPLFYTLPMKSKFLSKENWTGLKPPI